MPTAFANAYGSHRKVLDIKKIESIGWKPEISLEEGLKEIYKAMY